MNVCRIMRQVKHIMSTEDLCILQNICKQKDSGEKYQEFSDRVLETILASGMNKQHRKAMSL